MKKYLSLFFFALLFLSGCQSSQPIVSNIEERDANEIIVFLASKGITAQKVVAAAASGGTENAVELFNISVDGDRSTEAMALLNRYGLPRKSGTNLLELFAKSGLMSSDREELIRYQAGLAEELKNTIRKIDGVLDADVQLSFPPVDATPTPGAPLPKTTAAVYIKHQGIMEDPNSHMEIKIKRLLAGSVNGLDFENVSVISDRARFADIQLTSQGEPIGLSTLQQPYVNLWGVTLTKNSLFRFRLIFFSFILLNLALAAALGYMVYRFYPQLRFKKAESPETEGPEIQP